MTVTPLHERPVWVPVPELGANRFDPLYYDPTLTIAEHHFRSKGPLAWKRLQEVFSDIYSFGAYELTNRIQFVEPGPGTIPFVNVTEIVNPFVEFERARHIDQASHRLLEKSVCRPGTLLLSMSGSIGRGGVLPENAGECNSNQHLAKIIIDPDKHDAHFLAVYFSSAVGQASCEREAAGAVQKELYLYNISLLPVPDPNKPVRVAIGHKVRAAERLRAAAEGAKYSISRLFPSFTFHQRPLSGQWLGANMVDTGRLEAQYYQPQFLELMETIDKLACKVVLLRQLLSSTRHGASVTGANTVGGRVRFIRGTEIGPNRISTGDVVYLDDTTISELASAHFVKQGDLLVTRSGTVGMCAVARPREVGTAFGSFVIAVQIKKEEDAVSPEYVAAFLNSPLGQAQFRREENGAVQMNINNGELARIRVPLFSDSARNEVAKRVLLYNENLDRAEYLVRSAIVDVENLLDGKLNETGCIAEGRKLAEEFGLEVP